MRLSTFHMFISHLDFLGMKVKSVVLAHFSFAFFCGGAYSGYKPFVIYVHCQSFSSVACLFTLLMVFLDEQKFLTVVRKSSLLIFPLWLVHFLPYFKKTFSTLRS